MRAAGYFFTATGALLASLAPPVAAQESDTVRRTVHSLSLGAYHSRGDYGAPADTHVTYLPLSYEYRLPSWRLRVSAPYLRISGAGNVLVNVGGVARPGDAEQEAPRRGSADGPGDIVLSATYELPAHASGGPFVDLGIEVKLPTADETQGLGTGATDYGLHVDLSRMLGGSMVFSTVGYRFRGSSDWFEGLQDAPWVSLGFSSPLGIGRQERGAWSWGLIYDFRGAASSLSVDTHELVPYLSWSPDSSWSLMVYGARGFSRDSPEHALGLQASYSW